MAEQQRIISEITHGIAAVRRENKNNEVHVLHFCGYFEEPSAADFSELRRELEEDPEFGLIGQNFELILATQEMIDHVKASDL